MVSANLTAMVLAGVLLVSAGFVFLLALAALSDKEPEPVVTGDAVLVLDLWMNIADSPETETLADVLDAAVYGADIPEMYLLEVVDAIDRASSDDRIQALYLSGSLMPSNYGSGIAALREVRQAIERFSDSGKPVYAYAIDPTIRDYYLMSAADTVYLNPFGLLSLNGLASEMMYFGDSFEKYGIGVQTTRVGKYKSAVEMFTENKMSAANREQITQLVDILWGEILEDIGDGRGIEINELKALTNAQGFFTAELAVEMGLVDESAYLDEVIDFLTYEYGYDANIQSFVQVSISDYADREGFDTEERDGPSQVAVVYAEGDIVNGEGFENQVGGDRLARELRRLRYDPNVVAVVPRVNSPGGSAVASEVIQREVRLLQEEKPVVVSMGAMAASGGYWISTYADRIFAEPTTITGSIGVWGLLFDIKDLANEHGVTFDGVKTSQYADLFTLSRPKTPEEMAKVQQLTDMIYDEFLIRVIEGRGLSEAQVKEIAQGRVWSGVSALEIGLVDEIGGLGDAIHYAAVQAGVLESFTVVQVPEEKSVGENLLELLAAPHTQPPVVMSRHDVLSQALDILESELAMVRSFNDPRGVYARLPFSLSLQ